MKFLMGLFLVCGLAACSSTAQKTEAKEECQTCADSEKKEKCDCSEHKDKAAHQCGSEDGCKGHHGDKGHQAMALPAEAWPLDAAHIKGRISQDQFMASLSKNQEKINKSCLAPAQKYCGKETKDMNVSTNEVVCLYTKVNRVTREKLPQLDGTPCAKLIKTMTPSVKK